MNSLPASPARPGADLAAPRPAALAPGPGLLALGLLALSLAVLALLAFVPVRGSLAASGASFRPALAVMAPQTAPIEAPLMHRLDRDVTAVAAADLELATDPALPGQPAEAAPAPCSVAVPFPETTATLPPPAPLASPRRPPRAA